MSNGDKAGVKTLAIRLEPDLHAQLSVIAQLRESTITDEIREAIATHINTVRSDDTLSAKATSALEEIDRDAAVRRDAIASLLGEQPKVSRRNRGDKPEEGASQ
jgi:predicted DNA-binding protein